jgi:hypothetical protein
MKTPRSLKFKKSKEKQFDETACRYYTIIGNAKVTVYEHPEIKQRLVKVTSLNDYDLDFPRSIAGGINASIGNWTRNELIKYLNTIDFTEFDQQAKELDIQMADAKKKYGWKHIQ